jgi:Leucine-rich repeat (LRR) protein
MKLSPDYIKTNLKDIGKKEGIILLKELIDSSNEPSIRKKALENLGDVDIGRNFTYFEQLFLSDEDPDIRSITGKILKEKYLTHKKLIRLLEYTLTQGVNITQRIFSLKTLCSIDTIKTREIIVDYLKSFLKPKIKEGIKKFPKKILDFSCTGSIPQSMVEISINLILDDFYNNKLGYLTSLRNGKIVALNCESSNLKDINNIIGLKYLINLEYLTLQRNNITNISEVLFFQKLKSLNLSHNKLAKIHNLDNLGNLEELDLSNNNIKEIKNLQPLDKLKKLSLSNNSIKDIENLSSLKNLEFLDISYNEISEIDNLDELKCLNRLNLSFNKIEIIKGLHNLNNLMWLHLNDNKIAQIEGLLTLKKLKGLYLSNNSIEKIRSLENLLKLRKLELSNNKIKKIEGLNNLVELQELYLDNNAIENLEGFEGLNSLIMLHLGRNRISKFRNESIECLKSLNFIFLNENPLDQKSFSEYQKRIRFP